MMKNLSVHDFALFAVCALLVWFVFALDVRVDALEQDVELQQEIIRALVDLLTAQTEVIIEIHGIAK